jgi:hypothetical protein
MLPHTGIDGSSSESNEDNKDLRIASESLECALDRMRSLNCHNQSKITTGMVSNSVGSKGPSVPAMHEAIHNHSQRALHAR